MRAGRTMQAAMRLVGILVRIERRDPFDSPQWWKERRATVSQMLHIVGKLHTGSHAKCDSTCS